MTLTSDEVEKHAAEHPVLGEYGLWRIWCRAILPVFVVLRVRDGAIEISQPGRGGYNWEPLVLQPGFTLTPVLPNGGDLPSAEYDRGRADKLAAIVEMVDKAMAGACPSVLDGLGVVRDLLKEPVEPRPAHCYDFDGLQGTCTPACETPCKGSCGCEACRAAYAGLARKVRTLVLDTR